MANRNLICVDCGEAKWLSQKQWSTLVEERGSTGKVKRNFTCKKCKILKRDNRFEYEMKYSKQIKKFRTKLKNAHYDYLSHKDLNKLQKDFNTIFRDHSIDPKNIQYVTTEDRKYVLKIILKGVPFIGMIPISIYTIRGKTN